MKVAWSPETKAMTSLQMRSQLGKQYAVRFPQFAGPDLKARDHIRIADAILRSRATFSPLVEVNLGLGTMALKAPLPTEIGHLFEKNADTREIQRKHLASLGGVYRKLLAAGLYSRIVGIDLSSDGWMTRIWNSYTRGEEYAAFSEVLEQYHVPESSMPSIFVHPYKPTDVENLIATWCQAFLDPIFYSPEFEFLRSHHGLGPVLKTALVAYDFFEQIASFLNKDKSDKDPTKYANLLPLNLAVAEELTKLGIETV
ncbi:MAG: hypothetical protein WC527_05290 [Candidatus Margulisiibacteriota bacterium]